MIEKLRNRVEKEGLCNISMDTCNGKSLNFEDSYFDVIFLITVLGEIENKDPKY